jgi:uncharacterized protein DUF481
MSGTTAFASWRVGLRCVLLVAAWLGGPATAWAGPKVDTVQLTNGDRLTCEIKKLQQARLSISTDPLDSVSVHWAEVQTLTSPRNFEVTVESGDRYYGSLGTGAPGELVVSVLGGSALTLRLAEVISLVPIGSSVWSRMDGNVDVGFSFAQANVETHWTLNGGATYRGRLYRLAANLSSQLTARQDADRTSRNTLTLTGTRFLGTEWFATILGQFQQNEELQLDLRTVGGGGFGKVLSQTNHHTIALYSGLVYTHEQFVDQPGGNSAEAAVGGEINFFTPGKDDFQLTNSVVSYYDVTGRGRARIELQSAWRYEFLKDFYWSLNGVESFDSDPPDTEKKNDFSVSLSIGWKF